MVEWQKYKPKSKIVWTLDGQIPEIEPHTKVKHQLLESYLRDWVETITGNNYYVPKQCITLVDAFCGGGVYRDGKALWAGSPIRIIQAIESGWKQVQERKPYQSLDIQYIFIDRHQEHIACLKQQLREYGHENLLLNGKCHTHIGYFEDYLDELLSFLKQRGGYSFFFLDPFGNADLAGMSKAILSLRRTEILLNHMHHDGFVRPIVQAFKKGKDYGQKYLEKRNLNGYYDYCVDFDNLPHLTKQTISQNVVLQIYREQSSPRFAWTFAFMKNKQSVYYYLVHLSNKPTAVSVMRRNLWLYNNLDYQFHYGVFGLGYSTIEDFDQNLNLLDIDERNSQACHDRLAEKLDRFLFENANGLEFSKIFEETIDYHPATREDYMAVIHKGVIDGLWEMTRDGKQKCVSRFTNRDVIRPANAKQLILLPGQNSGRVSPKKKRDRIQKPKKSSKVCSGQLSITDWT